MSRNIIFVLMYHRHKILDLIYGNFIVFFKGTTHHIARMQTASMYYFHLHYRSSSPLSHAINFSTNSPFLKKTAGL
jgi:hypothetical protein